MVRLCYVIFLLCLLLPRPGEAQGGPCRNATLDPAETQAVDLAPFACVHADEGRTLTLDTMVSPQGAALLKPVESGLVDFGFGSARYWVQVGLQNLSQQPATWWVTHDIPVADDLNVYLVRQGAPPRLLLNLTSDDPFGARPIPHRHLVSPVPLEGGETVQLLISYVTRQATEMPLFAETVPGFFARTQDDTVQIVALTALILGMGLISTVYLYGLEGRRAFVYGAYVLTSSVLLFLMEGYAFQYLWPLMPAFNQVALAIFAPVSIALGLLFVSSFTETPGRHPHLYRLALFVAGMLVACSVFSAALMHTVWYKMMTLSIVCAAALTQVTLAAVAFRRSQSGALMLLVGFGALAAAFIFGTVGYMTEGLFPQEWVGIAIRLGFLSEAIAFSAAIALRIRTARRERDASLRTQLRLSEERLRLSEALRRAETDRQQAAEVAQKSREALASAAHDIRQPLASIQMALAGGEAARERIEGSLSYLDGILRASLENQDLPLGAGDADPPDAGAAERFAADIILSNIAGMFRGEAQKLGIDLRIVPSTAIILADPLSLMRIVGNLVSNALHHASAERVVLGCRRRGGRIYLEVHDNGVGIAEPDLARMRQRGSKGDGSGGHGLGLAIAADLAERQGFDFDLVSERGRGTVGRVAVPVGAPLKHAPLGDADMIERAS